MPGDQQLGGPFALAIDEQKRIRLAPLAPSDLSKLRIASVESAPPPEDGETPSPPQATGETVVGDPVFGRLTGKAVLPILHLNGYKIAGPTVLARMPPDELESLLIGYGHQPFFVEGDDPATMHQLMASTLDDAQRRVMWRELQDLVNEQAWLVWLPVASQKIPVRNRFGNVFLFPMSIGSSALLWNSPQLFVTR